ncbi:Gryzun, putative trafficking through golgi-domain-containing protein [Xylariomycetidae sp. FL2044]|nr:Gryzun, putative trafficking through golgi-domain-containing protein [Xylariomycetidae sp. FL2044]
MDEYPSGSLDHNVPLLVVSGLSTTTAKFPLADPELREQGILIRSELPPVGTREARILLRYIREVDAFELPWNSRDTSRKYKFRVRPIGREFLFPPRRARLPDDYESPLSAPVLHSPFSPLSPRSTLYPDGLIDTRWLEKHQELIPSTFLCFYTLTSDPTLATLHDNQLKTDINAVRNAIAQSGYKCRLTVVILSDQSPGSIGQFQERLENIRKSAALDPKASLFVLPTKRSEPELEGAVDSVLTAVYEQAAEYYRDLGRHSRKKRGRGVAPQPTIPPTSGTSHTLSLQGWNVRYDFKTAVFAEFRQEMDVALRSYEQAYNTLVGPDVLETIPAWEPRFNDARLLADIIAIRALRCLLWMGQSTAGVRRWQAHRDRMIDLIERRGRGTQNYGFKAWEARWCTVMANMVEKAEFPELGPSSSLLYRPPEKNLSADRLQPWELLHHPGYWYREAARCLVNRRRLALSIPEDDRIPPDESQPRLARKAYNYDTYMCPEPHEEFPLEGSGVNHGRLIFDRFALARTEFQRRHQLRTSVELALECSKELETMKEWKHILELLAPLWRNMAYRTEGWLDIMEALSWTLRSAAVGAGQNDLVVAIDWELLDRGFSKRPGWHYDISKSLDETTIEHPPTINIDDDHLTSFLRASFVFKNEEGKAGQICPAQLLIASNAFSDSVPVILDMVRIRFEGSLRSVCVRHEPHEDNPLDSAKLQVSRVQLRETEVKGSDASDLADDDDSETGSPMGSMIILEGSASLIIFPGQTRVFDMNIPLREPGDAKASSVEVCLSPGSFYLTYKMSLEQANLVNLWYSPTSSRKRITRTNAQNIKVLPRPPMMEVKIDKILEQYYTNEPIEFEIEILNEEDVDANTTLEVLLHGPEPPRCKVRVADEEKRSITGGEESRVSGISVGTISTASTAKAVITIDPIDQPAVYDLKVNASYHLVSDPGTPIIQQTTFRLTIVSPFEASYDLLPRLHVEWPSLFNYEDIQDTSDGQGSTNLPQGLAQKWSLATRYCSFAHEDLSILDLDVKVVATQGSVHCVPSKDESAVTGGLTISPKTIEESHFDIVAQKLSLDDRSPSTADLAFIVKWRRQGASETLINTTTLPVPRFYVTVSEPRVLAGVSYSQPPSAPSSPSSSMPQLLFLDITIENPSSHFLTFGLIMEPSDEFAFSGSKTTTVNVLPLARRSITYRLLPLVRGAWIRPTLVVRDKYFQKVLKIIPTEGMKGDKEGVLVWVPPEEEEEEGEEANGESDAGNGQDLG